MPRPVEGKIGEHYRVRGRLGTARIVAVITNDNGTTQESQAGFVNVDHLSEKTLRHIARALSAAYERGWLDAEWELQGKGAKNA